MELEVQKLKDELNKAVVELPLNSQHVIRLSVELDKLILMYYR